jgi:hypothetical protein
MIDSAILAIGDLSGMFLTGSDADNFVFRGDQQQSCEAN